LDSTIFLNGLQPTSLDAFGLELISSEQGTTTLLLHLLVQAMVSSAAGQQLHDLSAAV